MTDKTSELPALKVIDNLEALKVVADPLRTQIMEILYPRPMTVNQIADRLGLAPSKLYYHMNQLELHAFVHVVDTQVQGNIIEKFFWLTARDFELDKDLLQFAGHEASSEVHEALLSTLDATRADIVRSIEAREFNRGQGAQDNPRHLMLNRMVNRISDERATEFLQRLKDLMEEFSEETPVDDAAAPNYALTLAFYPSFYYNEDLDKPQGK